MNNNNNNNMNMHRRSFCSILLVFVGVLFVGLGGTMSLLWQASSAASYQELVQLSADVALQHLLASMANGSGSSSSSATALTLPPTSSSPPSSSPNKVNTSNTNIRRIHHLGERNSGTNFMHQMLHRAFPKYGPFPNEIPVLGYKHMFLHHELLTNEELQQFEEATRDALVLMQVRSPCDWALTMKKTPWHLCPPENHTSCAPGAKKISGITSLPANMTTVDFFQMPWKDGGEVYDSNWTTDGLYDNVFALRAHKLRLMQQIRQYLQSVQTEPQVHIIHMRDLEAAPTRVVQEMSAIYGLPLPRQPLRQGRSSRLHLSPCLTTQEKDLALLSIDWEMEALFGYFPRDCHTCRGAYVVTRKDTPQTVLPPRQRQHRRPPMNKAPPKLRNAAQFSNTQVTIRRAQVG